MTDKWQVSLTLKKNTNLFKSIMKRQVERNGQKSCTALHKDETMKHKGGEYMNKCFH